MPRFVVTGAPGTGKTSVIAALAEEFSTVAEPARQLIAEHKSATGEPTLGDRPALFVERLVARSIENFHGVCDGVVTVFDRGLPDCVAYASISAVDPEPILERARRLRYEEPVFYAAPWRQIYTTDELRRATFEQVEIFDKHLRVAYAELGYDTIELPMAPVELRAQFIAAHIVRAVLRHKAGS